MARALTQRMTTVAGWATLIVTLTVCWLGLHLTQIQYQSMSGILLDLEKRSAESVRAGLEGFLDEKESRILAAIESVGDDPARIGSVTADEPLAREPFLFLSDGTLLAPILGGLAARPVAAGDETAPASYEKAMRILWSVAPSAEKIAALEDASRADDLGPAWRLKARVLSLSLLTKAGERERAAAGYRALFDDSRVALLESSSPSYLQIVLARAECLAGGGQPAHARGVIEEALERLDRGESSTRFAEEELFLRRSQEVLARIGGEPVAAAIRAAKRHEERELSIAAMESLRDWAFARGRLESLAMDDARPQHFFEERTASGEKRPILMAWSRAPPVPSGPGLAAVGFRVNLENLEQTLVAGLAAVSPGSRLAIRSTPRGPEDEFIDLAGLRGERSFVRLGLEKSTWDTLVGKARKPFAFAKALIVLLMTLLVLALFVFLRGVKREIALSRMKTELVANVSHELKTPLALIRLFGETLLLGRANEESREKYYRIITRESERLTHLISSVLSFASIEAGRKKYDLKPCDIGRVVRDTLESYRFHLDEKGFTHRLECPETVPAALADPDAVSEALINLLENAVKYSGERKEVTVSVRPEKNMVKVSVADRGIGISAEEQGRVFEDYYRTSQARALGTRGSGLGLSLVRHILKAHGGRVELESRPGEGSVFTLVFPMEARTG